MNVFLRRPKLRLMDTRRDERQQRAESREPPKLMVVCGAYSLKTLRARDALQIITWRDLDGFFEHVWTIHPMVGASPEDMLETTGKVSSQQVTDRHTVIEAKVGRWRRFRRLPALNFLSAQCSLIVYLSRLIRRERVTIIRVGDPYYLGLLGLLVAKLNRVALVTLVNGNFDAIYESTGTVAYPRLFRYRWLEKKVERWVLSRSDLVVALNDNNLRCAIKNGADDDKAAVLPLGNMLAPVHFVTPTERASVVAEVGLTDCPFLIYVGRLEPVKHPEDVVAVLAQARLSNPRLRALLVGQGSMAKELKALASSFGVEDAVVLAGQRDQPWIASALAEASVVVSPLTGFALVEACLSGSPVVAYDVEWHSELIRDGESGLLVPYRDTEAMARAVSTVLADEKLARSLGNSGCARAKSLMDPRSLTDRHRQRYSLLLEARERNAEVRA